jgi:hypothetical protein
MRLAVGEEVGQLVHTHAMQPGEGDFSVEALPDGDGDVFGGRDARGEFGDFEVEMAMIVDADDLALEDGFQIFQIDDEAGDGIDFASHRDFERVVMAVAIAVGAFAEDALVLLRRPGIVPVVVGGGEFGLAG